MVPDTKNLAGLVPRIRAEGIRENDINIPTEEETERKRERSRLADGDVCRGTNLKVLEQFGNMGRHKIALGFLKILDK